MRSLKRDAHVAIDLTNPVQVWARGQLCPVLHLCRDDHSRGECHHSLFVFHQGRGSPTQAHGSPPGSRAQCTEQLGVPLDFPEDAVGGQPEADVTSLHGSWHGKVMGVRVPHSSSGCFRSAHSGHGRSGVGGLPHPHAMQRVVVQATLFMIQQVLQCLGFLSLSPVCQLEVGPLSELLQLGRSHQVLLDPKEPQLLLDFPPAPPGASYALHEPLPISRHFTVLR